MTDFPRLHKFSGSSRSWKCWYGRLQFFETNSITDASKKRANLLMLCGEWTYHSVCSHVQPKQPNQMSYEDIVEMLKAHFDPQLSDVFCRALFQRRNQRDDEGDKQLPLDMMLRDRLIFGISNSTVQQRLLAEKNLTFATVYDLAFTIKFAAKQQKAMESQPQEIQDVVAKVGSQRLRNGKD
ncbi:hypothetical protein MRX96_017475 [Rhipicephalus microplus]